MDFAPEDLKIETVDHPDYQPGGQQVLRHRGVRVTHLPTMTVAEVHDRRSHWHNRQTCLEMIEWALSR
jgi:protein subunit release factor A